MEHKNETKSKNELFEENSENQRNKSFTDLEERVDQLDGGHGWVVVVASFFIHFLVDGFGYSFSVFLQSFESYFKTGRDRTSNLGSVLLSFTQISAPLAAALVNSYGCKFVVILGSLISSFSLILCTFSPNLELMLIMYGVTTGIGFCFMYLSMVISVSFHFEKKRTLASGLSMCGTGVGMIVFAPMCNWLLEEYGWKNSLIILGALNLNGIPLGILLRPIHPPFHVQGVIEEQKKEKNQFKKKEHFEEISLKEISKIKLPKSLNFFEASEMRKFKRYGPLSKNDLFYNRSSKRGTSGVYNHFNTIKDDSSSSDNKKQERKNYATKVNDVESKIVSLLESEESQVNCCFFPVSKKFTSIFTRMTNPSLIKNPCFLLYCLGSFFGTAASIVPLIYITDRSLSIGLSSNSSAFLLSLIGLSNSINKIIIGFTGSHSQFNPLLFHNVCLVVGAVICFLMKYFTSFSTCAIFSVFFGMIHATTVILTPVIICNLVGLEKLTNGIGLVVMIKGISILISNPLTGLVSEYYNSDMNTPFNLAGVFFVVASVFCFIIHLK